MNKLKIAFVAALGVALVAFPSFAEGKSFGERNYDIGLTAGFWLPGTVSVHNDLMSDDFDKDAGLILKGFADMYIVPRFAIGAFASYSKSTLTVYGEPVDAAMYEAGIAFKPRFLLSPTVALKPGFNFGYRGMSAPDLGGDSDGDGMALDISAELQFDRFEGFLPHLEAGFLTQPVGGTDDVWISWAPIFYLGVGITF